MEIDWKHLATTPGYMSMKAAVAEEAKCTAKWKHKPDPRYVESFNFAINRAKHYAHHNNVPIENVLNNWELNRTFNFISYYTNHHFPKLHNKSLKPCGIRGNLKRCKKQRYYSVTEKRDRRDCMLRTLQAFNQDKRIKKPRWYKGRKRR